MKHLVKGLIIVLAFFPINQAAQAIEIGEIPPKVELKEKLGGRLDGKLWSSEELQGKVHVLFYVDPDEKDTNNDTSEALDKEKFSRDKFQSVKEEGTFSILPLGVYPCPPDIYNVVD
jgi:predicted transcriptional regulator